MTALNKTFTVPGGKQVEVLKDFNASFPEHSIVILLGKSGCGKTTLIRIIAGLESYDSGELQRPPLQKIGMVFQEPRLMPWLSVWNNIVFGIKKSKINKAAIESIIELTNLTGFENAYPHQLSGGMQQRTALARALVYNPEMILMDEPFASLDYFIRETMQNKLIEIHSATGKSIVFVTHSVDEALILGHKIIVMGDGQVRKEYDLTGFSHPRDILSDELITMKKDILLAIKSQ
ncbi:MAG: ABC transporter ATP-binding protein [Treponema sp.]|nr:ABC transporter ATP-binding protein [Treponema sp.]